MSAKNIDKTTTEQETTGKATNKETTASKQGQGKPESELRAAARRHGLTMGKLADRMGVSTRYLSLIGNGHMPWTQATRDKVRPS